MLDAVTESRRTRPEAWDEFWAHSLPCFGPRKNSQMCLTERRQEENERLKMGCSAVHSCVIVLYFSSVELHENVGLLHPVLAASWWSLGGYSMHKRVAIRGWLTSDHLYLEAYVPKVLSRIA
jgi:hypothetical protein